jgi:DNA-binding CsgD family transcriptional regulator
VLLLDAHARIVFANRIAREISARGDALVVDNERVRFLQAGVQEGFEEHLGTLNATPWFALSLPRSSGKRAYALLVKPLPGQLATHACYLYDFDEQRSVTQSLLARVYGFTTAESRIAMHLFNGMNVETVARTLGIRESTVRTHLTSILSKCEVPSLAALLQHLALGPRIALEL